VDEVTAKMRRRLFAKMAADGSIERKRGVPKPTTGLAAVELDVEPFAGMRPDHLRVEQQILLRQEWKHLSKSQRKSMLAGSVTSGNAVGVAVMCHECLKGEATCTPKGITYEDQKHKDLCHDVCLKWLKPADTSAICKCWIDCGAGGMKNQLLSDDAVTNYLSPRTLALVPADGDMSKRCIPLNTAAVKEFKAIKFRQVLWKQEQGTNFLLSFWWQPEAGKYVDKEHANQKIKSLRSLVYKGTYPYSLVTPLHVEADLTSGSPPYIKVTVGSKSFRSANRLHATEFSFIAVTKDDNVVRLYIGAGEKCAEETPVVDSWMTLDKTDLGGDPYVTTVDDSLWIVAPGAQHTENYGFGYLGKLNLIQAQSWDKEHGVDAVTGLTHPIPMWPAQVKAYQSEGKPKNCGAS
jgi:hypothetical protein